MTDYEISIALPMCAADFDRGEKVLVDSIAKRTKKVSGQSYGGVEAHGHEVLAGVFGRFGTLHDEAETARAALQIESGVGQSPVTPKRASSWTTRHSVVIRDKTLRRRRWRPVTAAASAALLLVVALRSGAWSWASASSAESVHSSFAELIEELGGESTTKIASAAAMDEPAANWVSTFAAGVAKGYRQSRSRTGAATAADEVTRRLLAFANEQLIKVEFVCPPPRRDGTKLAGDYRSPPQIRICPGYTGLEGAALVAHEIAHFLQEISGRLARKTAEEEADAVALTALKALWLPVRASDGGYLAKPGNHIPALVESRARIEAMATMLAQAAGGAP